MTSQGLRGTTLTSLRSNAENEAGLGGGLAGRKPGVTAMEAVKGRVTRTRAAMTDIGNKTNIQAHKTIPSKGTKLKYTIWGI
jgi:hypothetical protein